MLEALDSSACDYVMPDLSRIGGVTGWIEAAGMRAVVSRCRLASVPGGERPPPAATPTGHWIEYFDWSNALLEEPLRIVGRQGGHSRPAGSRHGLGQSKIGKTSDDLMANQTGGISALLTPTGSTSGRALADT